MFLTYKHRLKFQDFSFMKKDSLHLLGKLLKETINFVKNYAFCEIELLKGVHRLI